MWKEQFLGTVLAQGVQGVLFYPAFTNVPIGDNGVVVGRLLLCPDKKNLSSEGLPSKGI